MTTNQLHVPFSWLGIILSILACLLLAISSVFCRKLKLTKTVYIVFYMNLFIFVLTLIAQPLTLDIVIPKCGWNSFWFAAGAVFYITGMAFFFYSSTLTNSGRMSIFRGSSILFAYVLQVIMLGLVPTWHTVVGAVLMMIAPVLASADDACVKFRKKKNIVAIECENICHVKLNPPVNFKSKTVVNIDSPDLTETKI